MGNDLLEKTRTREIKNDALSGNLSKTLLNI